MLQTDPGRMDGGWGVTEDRDRILAHLRPEDVLSHLSIDGTWRGRNFRSRRCPAIDVDAHGGDAFWMSRDGKMHCHVCDYGGGLLDALALGERLGKVVNSRVVIDDADFPDVLRIAAGIAGVELEEFPDFGGGAPVKPPRPARPAPPPLPPLQERVAVARARAAWVWDKLMPDEDSTVAMFLRMRGLDPAVVQAREKLKHTPLLISPKLRDAIDSNDPSVSKDLRALWWTMGVKRGTLAIVIPVRHVQDGSMVDLRCRRLDPEPEQPKIIGMVGGITSAPAEGGSPRRLIACYGNPHVIDADLVFVTEGGPDYLTGLSVFPDAQTVSAVESGSLALVAQHVARELAKRDRTSRMVIVEHDDQPRTLQDGRVIPGAADQAVNEQPVAAAKAAIAHLGPRRVGWLFCDPGQCERAGGRREVDGNPVKDLNDAVRAGADPYKMICWNAPIDEQ